MNLSAALNIDPAQTADHICSNIEEFLQRLRRRGVVLGISGGVDSAVVAALCARAIGKDRVLGLFMPERDSSADSLRLGQSVASELGVSTVLEDISPILLSAGCYQRRDDAIRAVIPHYDSTYKCKIVLPDLLEGAAYQIFSIVVQSPDGFETKARLPIAAYLSIVAATNFKQRVRKMLEYYHADRLNYAVAGTPNLLEHDQGFFVKNGDGAADLKPIAHLYKSQVYQLAEYLGINEEVRQRSPSTDTYSLPQTQEEFYFALPYSKMDLAIYAKDHGIPAREAAPELNLTHEQVEKVYTIIDAKRKAATYLHRPPLTLLP